MNLFEMLSGEYKPLGYKTRSIMVINSKGGSGKTTVATNLASYYATAGVPVALADFDPQGSSIAWLGQRPDKLPPIHGLAAWRESQWLPQAIDTVILDVAAGVRDRRMAKLLQRSQTVLIPVQPSPMDIRAAQDFIYELLQVHRKANLPAKVAVLANRVKENTRAYDTLREFLEGLGLPFLTSLRESQHYITAAERGLGIFELGPASVSTDLDQWRPIIRWLKSKRSRPPSA